MRSGDLVRSFDWVLFGTAVLLVFVGLAMLFSATSNEAGLSARFVTQVAALVLGIVLCFAISTIPYHVIRRHTLVIYAAGIASLIFVAVFAGVVRGTTSRLEVFGLQIQPSEFVKVAVIISLAWLLARISRSQFQALVVTGVAVAIPSGLIFLEPDTGSAALLVAVWIGLLLFTGLPWRWFMALSIVGSVAGLAGWRWVLLPYQKDRLTTFMDPWADPLGSGYNVVQSMVAFGSGKIAGRGLGHGPQSQLKFLPEQHTDFIMASIGEELGLIGLLLVVVLYIIMLWRIMYIARATEDPFGRLLAIGGFFLLLVSFVVSVGMNMGLLPVTGIPLPLVSYGGSNLVSTFLVIGLVESVHLHNRWVTAAPQEITHF